MSILMENLSAEKLFRVSASAHLAQNDDLAVRHGGLAHLPCLNYPQKSNHIRGHYTTDLSMLVSVFKDLFEQQG